MFRIDNLFPFIQLMGGINLIPYFIDNILKNYITILNNNVNKQSKEILDNFNDKLDNIQKENIVFSVALSVDDEIITSKLLDKLEKQRDKVKEKSFLKEMIYSEIIKYSDNLLQELLILIDKESKEKIPHSFILSGIYCIIFLIYIPILSIFLSKLNPIISLKLSIVWLIAIYILFQVILYRANSKFSYIITSYILVSFSLLLLLIISLNGTFNTIFYSDFNFISLKTIIPIFLVSTVSTYIIYFLKYFSLFKTYKKRVKAKVEDGLQSLSN